MTFSPTTLGLQASFGFGDRIGTATPGHVAAMNRAGEGIAPIFPQQSIREMQRTGRNPTQVMNEAMEGAVRSGWTSPTGADADHLKTNQDVDVTATAGFTFFTVDPSGYVDQKADNYDEATLRSKFDSIRSQTAWYQAYAGRTIALPNGTSVELTDHACMRAAVKYGAAISHAISLSSYIDSVQTKAHRDYEIEISVDETNQPTTLAEHFIIAEQCLKGGMRLISLAPRFIGDFEKGVDYRGDLKALDQSMHDHAALAKLLGPYKISLHSGSDKLSMYGILAKATQGAFHVKTAGTSYLEALRVVAKHDPKGFREIIDFARVRYDVDKATYHVSATLKDAPLTHEATDLELEKAYLECWSDVAPGKGFTKLGRQILHCTFGSVLTNSRLGPLVKDCLIAHPETYTEVLEDHFARHLIALAY